MSTVPKGIWLALAGSIALNMFGLGVFAARGLGPRDHGGHDAGRHAFIHQSGLHSAGPEVQSIMKQHRGAVRERVHALTDARKRLRDALTAEHYDPARVEAGFSEVRDKSSAMQADMHGVLSDVAKHLAVEQRKRMANALRRSRREMPSP